MLGKTHDQEQEKVRIKKEWLEKLMIKIKRIFVFSDIVAADL